MTGWIFESLILPRDDAAPLSCEDRVLVMPPDFAAVIDGASDITGQRYGGQTGGALAAEAIAAAFAAAWFEQRQGGADPFATAAAALAVADRAINGVYSRLGLTEAAQDPARRFRAAFAAASLRRGVWRGVGVGDCALRLDTAAPVLRDHPAEAVLATWRAAMIAIRPEMPEAEIRATLVGGLDRADAASRRAAESIALADPQFARHVLARGLAGMRAAPPGDALAFGVADGVGDMGQDFCWQVARPEAEVRALALWTDGWLVPGSDTAEDWLGAARAADARDPRRTGPHRCVKGPAGSGRHDDMALVLIGRAKASGPAGHRQTA